MKKMKTSPSKRGRPAGSKNKAKQENLSPWINELSDLNQEVNALRYQLRDAEAVIRYLERKYENT